MASDRPGRQKEEEETEREKERESETSESERNHIVWISCAFRYKILLSATLSMILTTG